MRFQKRKQSQLLLLTKQIFQLKQLKISNNITNHTLENLGRVYRTSCLTLTQIKTFKIISLLTVKNHLEITKFGQLNKILADKLISRTKILNPRGKDPSQGNLNFSKTSYKMPLKVTIRNQMARFKVILRTVSFSIKKILRKNPKKSTSL